MELKLSDVFEFEQFVLTYAAGMRARNGGGTVNELVIRDEVGNVAREYRATGSTAAQVIAEAQAELERFNTTTPNAGERNDEGQTPVEPGVEAPKPRKRRTKAEMEAARAAEQAGEPLVTAEEREALTEQDAEPENQQNSEPVTTETHPLPTTEQPAKTEAEHVANIVELAGYTDQVREDIRGNAVMFEPDRMAQMNEGREAIKAKGIAAYNAIAKALDLSVNIALHNDDQVRLHRAGIAHLMASK